MRYSVFSNVIYVYKKLFDFNKRLRFGPVLLCVYTSVDEERDKKTTSCKYRNIKKL